jgi:hypothetical protein
MARSVQGIGVALLLAGASCAPEGARARLRPITAPLREVAVRVDRESGRARRAPLELALDPKQPVYLNSCPSGYHFALSSAAATGGSQAQAVVDQGRIPSTASSPAPSCKRGTSNVYEISRFQIGYCTTTGAPVEFVTSFWSNRGGVCPNTFPSPADATRSILGLPRSSAPGAQACYLVTIDIGTPGIVLNGGASDTTTSRFAWASQYPRTTGGDGPIVAGNPWIGGCAPCTGTVWEIPTPTSRPGSGLGIADGFWIEGFGGPTGCWNFFGNPYAAFHLRLDARVPSPTASFCDAADGSHALCPCGASNPLAGCDIAQGGGVRLEVAAQMQLPNAATLVGTGYPPAGRPSALVLRSNALESFPFRLHDGVRCIDLGGIVRLAATTASGGVSKHTIDHVGGGGHFYYQIWFRNTPVSYCMTAGPGMGASNLSNGWILTW